MPRVIHYRVAVSPTGNVQATHSTSADNDRSESSVAVNPTNPLNLVAGSKKFINPHKYDFTLATVYSLDEGKTWTESAPLPLLTGPFGVAWGGISDPALAWDDQGSVYLVAQPFAPNDGPTQGIAIYKSTDGGKTWGTPTVIHSGDDDKQWAAGDTSPTSAHRGNVYAVWDNGGSARLLFARTTDHGATWKGLGGTANTDSVLALDSFSPEISLAPDGTIYIAYWNRASNHTSDAGLFTTSVSRSIRSALKTRCSPRIIVATCRSLLLQAFHGRFPRRRRERRSPSRLSVEIIRTGGIPSGLLAGLIRLEVSLPSRLSTCLESRGTSVC